MFLVDDFSYSPQSSPARIPKHLTPTKKDNVKQQLKQRTKPTLEVDVEVPRVKCASPTSPFEITNAYFFGSTHNEGGRALGTHLHFLFHNFNLDAIIRPYAAKVAGTPLSTHFDRHTLVFNFEQKISVEKEGMSSMTEIFVPGYHYGNVLSPIVTASAGEWKYDKVFLNFGGCL